MDGAMRKELGELAASVKEMGEVGIASYTVDKISAQESINEKTLALLRKIDERLELIETGQRIICREGYEDNRINR
jgi:hypothetical protein